jgi:hypothetical protein
MEITYKIEIIDLVKFSQRFSRKEALIKSKWILACMVLLAVYLGSNNILYNIMVINGKIKIPESLLGGNIILIILYDFLLLLAVFYIIRYIRLMTLKNYFRDAQFLAGEKKLILSEKFLIFITPYLTTDYKYNFIYKIDFLEEYYYLSLLDKSKIIIPIGTPGLPDFIKNLEAKINVC